MGTKKVMKVVNPTTGEMECSICGSRHWANIRPNSRGKFFKGSYQCQHGCQPDLEQKVNGLEKK